MTVAVGGGRLALGSERGHRKNESEVAEPFEMVSDCRLLRVGQ